LLCNVNLIPVNPVTETGMHRPTGDEIRRFTAILTEAGIETNLREERGTDIDAACGQLRKRQGGENLDHYSQV
ncbi:MAG TPA: 23S rRNA (adenine(2503)-C(2))-methyltransferase RlmN, partial [Verrucomicrobiae bacterium]|nr:23S rRNA (adenine(2503)-C(2))-methyltransferase RlmN [Verrucomicrobiae bacterium]